MTKKKMTCRKGRRFVTSFVHWRSGKRIYAKDHGHKAFPLGPKK